MAELYTLPDGWEWKKLDNFVSIKGGKRIPKGKKLLETKTNYPYIRVTDFNDFGSIDLNNIQYITEDIYNEIRNYIISKDDIYISIAGTIGKTGIIPNELDGANLTENAAKLVFDNSKYDKYFLLYFTNSIPFLEQIGLATKTVAMPKLALTRLKEVEISLPPLKEQKRIVAKLDILFAKIDKAIALHQKNIDEANVFIASVLNDVFVELEEKYEKKYLDEISFLIDGDRGSNYPKKEEFFENEFCLFLNAKNVTRNGFLFLEKQFITKEKDNILRKGKLDREDLIITTRGTIGNVSIYDKSIEFDNVRINSGMAIIRLKDKDLIYNRYIYKYLFSPQFLNYLSDVQSGSAQPQITIKNLKESIIPIPPLKTQQKVVSYLDEISQKMEKIKQIQKEKMQSLKALKASILDQAFKGEL